MLWLYRWKLFGWHDDGRVPILAEIEDKELNLQIDTLGKFMGSGSKRLLFSAIIDRLCHFAQK